MRSTETSDMIKFFTGLEVTEDRLWSRESSEVERMMVTAVEEIRTLDRELIRASQALHALAAKIEANVDAVEATKRDPQHRFFQLNPSGEIQGGVIGRVDVIIATREAKITQLKYLAHLHRQATGQA